MPLAVTRSAEPPAEWQELAAASGAFYHDPRWVRAVAREFKYRLHCLTARDATGAVGLLALAEVPGLLGPRRLVSFPFSYAAGPLAPTVAVDHALCAAAVELARERRVRRIEIKRRGIEVAVPDGFERSTHYATYRLRAGDAASGDALSENVRRNIRRAERQELVVERQTSATAWLAMARLHEITATGHGVPAPPRRFFTDTCRTLQREQLADLYLARARNGWAAGIVVWKGRREWIYAFGASHPDLLHLRPNHALLWEIVQQATTAGVAFDLGRAAPEQEGLVRFKAAWGGQPVSLAYDYWPNAAGLNVAPRDRGTLALAARAWSLLPVSIARFGNALYRYLG